MTKQHSLVSVSSVSLPHAAMKSWSRTSVGEMLQRLVEHPAACLARGLSFRRLVVAKWSTSWPHWSLLLQWHCSATRLAGRSVSSKADGISWQTASIAKECLLLTVPKLIPNFWSSSLSLEKQNRPLLCRNVKQGGFASSILCFILRGARRAGAVRCSENLWHLQKPKRTERPL